MGARLTNRERGEFIHISAVESSFPGKTKNEMLTASCQSLTLPIQGLFNSLRLYPEQNGHFWAV